MADWRTTFVTVVFEPELGLLELQARSLAAFVDPDLVAEIVVIDNGWRGMSARAQRRLKALYGPHAERVRVVRAADVVEVPSAGGWGVQQILKLEIARQVATPTYLVLDAKNHFVAPLRIEHLTDDRGRARIDAHSFDAHPHRSRLERVLRFFDLDPAEHLGRFTSTVTPFLLEREQVLRAMSMVAADPADFPVEFVERGLTEFFLYGASVVAEGQELGDRFALQSRKPSTVWPAQAGPEKVAEVIAGVRANGEPVFSVHRDACAVLPEQSQALLVELWLESGLFANRGEAVRHLAVVRRQTRMAKAHKVAGRASNMVRSASASVGLRGAKAA